MPSICWIPKLYRNPAKAKFIIASPIPSLKPLTKLITQVFKVMNQTVQNHSNKCCYFSGVDTFWAILNNEVVITRNKNLHRWGKSEPIMTFNFFTLYTKIPTLTDFGFNGGSHKNINVNMFGAKWISKQGSYCMVFDKCCFKKGLKYVLNNCFLKFGSKIFQQVIGIPVGWDPSLLWNILHFFIPRTNRHGRQDGQTWFKLGNVVICFDS